MKSFRVSHGRLGAGLFLGTVTVNGASAKFVRSKRAIAGGFCVSPTSAREITWSAIYLAKEPAAVGCETESGFSIIAR